jgi:hypothetical protein
MSRQPLSPPAELDLEDIAEGITAVLDGQDAILKMLWSIRSGVNASFLDDSDFQVINMRRNFARNNLRVKSAAAKAKKGGKK